jgi:hypothetical protein
MVAPPSLSSWLLWWLEVDGPEGYAGATTPRHSAERSCRRTPYSIKIKAIGQVRNVCQVVYTQPLAEVAVAAYAAVRVDSIPGACEAALTVWPRR